MSALDSRLAGLREQRLLTELDVQFATFICSLEGGENPDLGMAAALVSNCTQTGHVCLQLDAWGGVVLEDPVGDRIELPEKGRWMETLRSASVVGRPGDYRPLVLDDAGRLYLYRYWDYEQQLARDVLERAGRVSEAFDANTTQRLLRELFAGDSGSRTDWQKVAAALAVNRNLSVITGGPGTGKTTTVVRILALMLQLSDRTPAIALAAPTGKAAARLQESVRGAKRRLGLEPSILASIPEHAVTLHRLLGGGHGAVTFRHGRDNPLPLDVLILDEASMVDLAMMSKLLQALPEKSRLILLGDRNQLSSVEAGAVLGDICSDWSGFSDRFRKQLQQVTGETLPGTTGGVGPLSDSIVELRHSYRFGSGSGIGRLADAVNRGDDDEALALFASPDLDDLQWHGDKSSPVEIGAQGYRGFMELVASGADEATLFDAFEGFRVLCATRRGERGLNAMNEGIRNQLGECGLVKDTATWYPGRPVLITRNDYNLHLYNGDIGLALPRRDGTLGVCFRTPEGELRWFPPSRLPEHETVFAMTVHKSQGSEFGRVLLVLPDEDLPILTRELLYTGLTRTVNTFEISVLENIFRISLKRVLKRNSGLKEQFWRANQLPGGQLQLPGLEE
ncbi:MAG: exodeoxyribonuclease V subunit alpha [Sedimenticola sp.]